MSINPYYSNIDNNYIEDPIETSNENPEEIDFDEVEKAFMINLEDIMDSSLERITEGDIEIASEYIVDIFSDYVVNIYETLGPEVYQDFTNRIKNRIPDWDMIDSNRQTLYNNVTYEGTTGEYIYHYLLDNIKNIIMFMPYEIC